MILDGIRYLFMVMGACMFALVAFFAVVGFLAYARQARADRAFDREHYARQRTPGMGELRSVPEAGEGDVWHHRFEFEDTPTPVFDSVVEWAAAPMSRHDGFADEAPCGRCSKPVTLDHDPPCEHGEVACPECTHAAVCLDCRLVAEREMHEGDEYDPKADPFYVTPASQTPRAERWCPIHRMRGCTCGYGYRA